jgi:hypothetical protein
MVAEAPGGETRRRGREAALQMLYQSEVGRLSMPLVRGTFWELGQPEAGLVAERVREFAERLATVRLNICRRSTRSSRPRPRTGAWNGCRCSIG